MFTTLTRQIITLKKSSRGRAVQHLSLLYIANTVFFGICSEALSHMKKFGQKMDIYLARCD